ncbi:MAG: HDOD domain-containing protein [Kangiellaceae bacterium]|jgi:EAL and modified HD-GYP domain-containing signal transduction protein|nr:HDOD domain-containing protein [Kangiellaceae bacterium]
MQYKSPNLFGFFYALFSPIELPTPVTSANLIKLLTHLLAVKMIEPSNSNTDVLLARQPIFDRNMSVYGYELLFRAGQNSDSAEFLCGDTATSLLLLNNYASLTQAKEHHRVPAFINVTENLLRAPDLLPVPPENVVLEVLEDVTPDQSLIDAITRYKQLGFKIALDDYPFTKEFEQLLEHADFIKIDVLNYDLALIQRKLDQMKNFDAQLLAEKVEDHESYVNCLKLGFHLFQGYFFERPQIVRGMQLPSNKQVIVQILSYLYDPEVAPEQVADQISLDAQLCYRLLKIINSAAYGLPRKIDSVKEAIIMLGLQQLKRWITLLAFSSDNDTPAELLRTLLVRARTCETLASKKHESSPEAAFTVGLFSGIDALLGADLNYLLNELPLSDEIIEAITQYKGNLGEHLRTVITLERADWEQLPKSIDPIALNIAYCEAIKWCDELTNSID